MSDMSKTSQLTDRANSRWVRLRTLIALRWVAIIGQSTAIAISILWFNLNINLGLLRSSRFFQYACYLDPRFLKGRHSPLSLETIKFGRDTYHGRFDIFVSQLLVSKL